MKLKSLFVIPNLLIIFIFCFLFGSCNYTIDGTYVLKIDKKDSKDSLFILKNNIFYQHYVNDENKSFYNEGTWNYKDKYIEFDDFVLYLRGYGPTDYRRGGFWLATYDMTLAGGVYISVDDNLNYEYARIKRDIPKYVTTIGSLDTTTTNKK